MLFLLVVFIMEIGEFIVVVSIFWFIFFVLNNLLCFVILFILIFFLLKRMLLFILRILIEVYKWVCIKLVRLNLLFVECINNGFLLVSFVMGLFEI